MERTTRWWATVLVYLFVWLTALAGIVSLGVFGRFLSETQRG